MKRNKMLSQMHLVVKVGFLGIVGLAVIGCGLFNHHHSHHPTTPQIKVLSAVNATYGQESGQHFGYELSDTSGITIMADLSTYHIPGKPYGTWVVNATWRSEDRKIVCPGGDLGVEEMPETYKNRGCAHAIVPVSVDEATGQAIAVLPPEFLDTVFQEAHKRYQANQDVNVWFHRPGLYLNFHCSEETYQYFNFK